MSSKNIEFALRITGREADGPPGGGIGHGRDSWRAPWTTWQAAGRAIRGFFSPFHVLRRRVPRGQLDCASGLDELSRTAVAEGLREELFLMGNATWALSSRTGVSNGFLLSLPCLA